MQKYEGSGESICLGTLGERRHGVRKTWNFIAVNTESMNIYNSA